MSSTNILQHCYKGAPHGSPPLRHRTHHLSKSTKRLHRPKSRRQRLYRAGHHCRNHARHPCRVGPFAGRLLESRRKIRPSVFGREIRGNPPGHRLRYRKIPGFRPGERRGAQVCEAYRSEIWEGYAGCDRRASGFSAGGGGNRENPSGAYQEELAGAEGNQKYHAVSPEPRGQHRPCHKDFQDLRQRQHQHCPG